ncbi:MAG: hypothetical protein FWG14_06565 [Peptococcaceae bacterium]|nr:hypothetical protein [Peptococcaceae bacterium]
MRKRLLAFATMALILLLIGVTYFIQTIYTPETILKTAIKEKELSDRRYILCQRVRITGFDWELIKNEDGKKTNELCNVVGASPFSEYPFRHEFVIANNTYIFYVEEKNVVYSEEIKEDEIIYVVTGWDILYPVKHSEFFGFDLFKTKKYITPDDLQK